MQVAALAGVLSIATAGLSGLLFIASGFANNTFSYLMAMGFISAFIAYFDLLHSAGQAGD